MSRIRSKSTAPERHVRRILRSLGYPIRTNAKHLPGKPDVTIPKLRIAIFVHGCFWHQHQGCHNCVQPKSNVAFWARKLTGNVERDRRNRRLLRALGWKAVVVWECRVFSKGFPARLGRRVSQLAAKMEDCRQIENK